MLSRRREVLRSARRRGVRVSASKERELKYIADRGVHYDTVES
jgi:hypothetical protein